MSTPKQVCPTCGNTTRPQYLPCPVCGVMFDRGGTRAKFCSYDCTAKYHENKRRGSPKRRQQVREAAQRYRKKLAEQRVAS